MARRMGTRQPLKALHDKPLFEPAYQMRRGLKLLEVCRTELGEEVELLHDMHERLSAEPGGAVLQGGGEVPHVLP